MAFDLGQSRRISLGVFLAAASGAATGCSAGASEFHLGGGDHVLRRDYAVLKGPGQFFEIGFAAAISPARLGVATAASMPFARITLAGGAGEDRKADGTHQHGC